jgi:trigger factor
MCSPGFTVSEISRYTQAEIGKELFEKVYGPDAVKDEAEFRGKVKEDIKAQLRADEDYRFEIDARNAIIEQLKDLAMPEAFLRRYLKTQNEKVDDETFDKEFPGALEALKWQLVEDEIGKKHELKLTEDDLQQEARNFVRMQLRQYGLSNAADDLVENFATESLKREEDRRRIADRALQVKIFDALKQDMKLKPTAISLSDFNKLFEQEAKK